MIKVLLVEDSEMWQRNLSEDIGLDESFDLAGIASTKEEAIDAVKKMDINLTDNNLDGIDAAEEIKDISDCKIIMLTSLDEKEIIEESFAVGAKE
ncbi:response regulator [Chengkuizengella axinellae]|uniref:Response regulator n=1 Tax=Chengkuizengella axinellae TaxID=3064388 RepID=A0ABT9ITM8_9BACL|nr:response regulator [Chengkuizengella sp. 2205SS18-9]MDP5272668.1 response regulator [Chengkuizengella sp. 2205SS18-9]